VRVITFLIHLKDETIYKRVADGFLNCLLIWKWRMFAKQWGRWMQHAKKNIINLNNHQYA
jgi:hypothetical protein